MGDVTAGLHFINLRCHKEAFAFDEYVMYVIVKNTTSLFSVWSDFYNNYTRIDINIKFCGLNSVKCAFPPKGS